MVFCINFRAKIVKISFKRKQFFIQLRRELVRRNENNKVGQIFYLNNILHVSSNQFTQIYVSMIFCSVIDVIL